MTALLVIDSVGPLQYVSPTQVEKALAQGQIEPTDRGNVFRLIEQPLVSLSGKAKRAIYVEAHS